MNIVENKSRFMDIATRYIKREGIDRLLSWLDRNDFFVCPASTQYNLPVEGGLCQHALNVSDTLVRRFYGKGIDELTEEDVAKTFEGDMTLESILIVSMFSSVNKVNCYLKDFKNVKVNGKWEQQEYWKWDETFVYSGRGSKSVFILQQYMRLWIEEAQAIAFYLAGEDDVFSNISNSTYRKVYEQSRLALYLHLAEIESTYFLDNRALDALQNT